jgi:hypothetical protein
MTSMTKPSEHKEAFPHDTHSPRAAHWPSLNEIQMRACRIHQMHGAVRGGYTLDDWLEAEHELDEELREATEKNEQAQ